MPAGHGQPSLPTAPTKPQAARRTPWPSWSWLPNTVFVEDLLATNGIDIDQTDDAVLEKYCRLAAAMTTVINWLPGRTVVYYDTTLLESLNQHAYRTAHPGPSALPVARVGGSTWTCRGSSEGLASSRGMSRALAPLRALAPSPSSTPAPSTYSAPAWVTHDALEIFVVADVLGGPG